MKNKTHEELIKIIVKLSGMVSQLLNENAEKENMIEVLMTEFKGS